MEVEFLKMEMEVNRMTYSGGDIVDWWMIGRDKDDKGKVGGEGGEKS